MTRLLLILMGLGLVLTSATAALSALIDYSGQEVAWDTVTNELEKVKKDMEDLIEGDPLTDQYAPMLVVSATGGTVYVETHAHGTPALDLLCGELRPNTATSFEFSFREKGIWGAEFYVLDVSDPGLGIDYTVFDLSGDPIDPSPIFVPPSVGDLGEPYTHVAFSFDAEQIGGATKIGGVSVASRGSTDGIGFDDIVLAFPEPSTLVLLAMAALAMTIGWWRRRHVA